MTQTIRRKRDYGVEIYHHPNNWEAKWTDSDCRFCYLVEVAPLIPCFESVVRTKAGIIELDNIDFVKD